MNITLVISTNTCRHPEPKAKDLRISLGENELMGIQPHRETDNA